MSKQVIYGTKVTEIANEERLTRVFEAQRQNGKPAFYVLPSHLWLQAARQKQPGLLFTTFDDIASYILEQVNQSYIPLSEQERTLFFQQFMREETSFTGSEHEAKAQGYADTYGQIKRLGLTTGDLPPSLTDLSSLFTKYEQKVAVERHLLDPENIILQAIALLETKASSIRMPQVVIDGYYDFSPLQALLIEALKKADLPVEIYVPVDEDYEVVNRTVTELTGIGFCDLRGEHSSERLDAGKEVIAATTSEEQWRGVMEEIRSSKMPPKDIGILLVNERQGLPELERYAKAYSIPLNKAKKRPVSTTALHSFLLSLIKEMPLPRHTWSQLHFFEKISKLYFVNGYDYAKQKESFIQSGTWLDLDQEQLFTYSNQVSWKKSERLINYLKQLEQVMNELPVIDYWRGRLESDTDVDKLRELAAEYKAWSEMLHHINDYRQRLIDKGLEELTLSLDLFAEWFKELGDNLQLFEERGVRSGVSVFTWRDVGLFKGEKLYVIGMNEGVFPKSTQLSGYVQDRDLNECPIRFGSPTQTHLRQKQKAHFIQLNYLAQSITFTYVKGGDPEHPLLMSSFLTDLSLPEREWSLHKRMKEKRAYSQADAEEKASYHLGQGCKSEAAPANLLTIQERLTRLADGMETVATVSRAEREKTVSVTALEQYARCSFRYGMEKVFAVKEPLAEQERILPMSIGQMVHELIEEVYKELGLIGVKFAEASEEKLIQAPALIEERFEEKWTLIEKESYEVSPFELQLSKKEWQRHLQNWWLAERKHFWDNRSLAEMKIEGFEKPVELSIPLDEGENLTLRGIIDRIDVSDHSFVIYDYKTGMPEVKLKEISQGLKLQLPLYALAIRKELERKYGEGIQTDGATYIWLKEPTKRAGNGIWHPEQTGKKSNYSVSANIKNKDETLGTESFMTKYELNERIKELWSMMDSTFHVKPLDCSDYCQYRSICRITLEQKESSKQL